MKDLRWPAAHGVLQCILCALLTSGCFIDRGGLAGTDGGGVDSGAGVDSSMVDMDGAMPDSAIPDVDSAMPGVDAGEVSDGGDAGSTCTPAPELCDGVDNDCDPATADGADEPTLGVACDDPADADLCAEGAWACAGGAMTCAGDDGDQPDEVEVCDGVDNDCNGATGDGSSDPMLSSACDGADADLCEEGTYVGCSGGVLTCDDTSGDSTESCNGADDDCDGTIDEGAGCPCDHRTFGGHAYLFCESRMGWTGSRNWCRSGGRGYELVSLDDEAEQRWVDTQADEIRRDRDWWIGATDRDEHSTEGTFVWVADGSALVYDNWRTGEPNDSGGEDCAELRPDQLGPTGVPGGWNDDACSASNRFVCEAGP